VGGRPAALPDQPESRRPRPEPDRRRLCLPVRSLVEPRRRGPSRGPRAPHRPDADRLRLPAGGPRHRRGEDPGAPGREAHPGRRHRAGRRELDGEPQSGGFGAAAVVRGAVVKQAFWRYPYPMATAKAKTERRKAMAAPEKTAAKVVRKTGKPAVAKHIAPPY